MRLPNKNTIIRLKTSLAVILRGRSLEEWSENIATDFLRISGQDSPPLELGASILSSRKAKVSYQANIAVRARLKEESDGFVIILPPPRKYKSFLLWWRLVFAHEIAHTFLYDLQGSQPIPLARFPAGDKDLEWLCHYVAKRFLIPSEWLRQETERFPAVNSGEFSLTVLKKLEKIFLVPWKVVAERLVEDMSIWNCIILHFNYIDESWDATGRTEGEKLRLTWHTIPPEINKKVYVPIGERRNGRMIFPRAKGLLAKFLSEYLRRGEYQASFTDKISCKVLNSSTTGNLGKFLCRTLGVDDVEVYCAIKLREQNELPGMGDRVRKLPSIVIAIPLETSGSLTSLGTV